MKPHARYGHTPHSTAAGGGGGRSSGPHGAAQQYISNRRGGGGGGDDSVDGGAMIEEYKLEEQLSPFYETAATAASPRCFLPGSTSSPSSSSKPMALRTVSIMETLSELAGAPPDGRRRAPDVGKAASVANTIQRRAKKTLPGPPSVSDEGTNMVASLLDDFPQWSYPTKRPSRPDHQGSSVTSPRVWDVSRLTSKLGSTASSLAGKSGRSVEHILPNNPPNGGLPVAQGYGSLERRRRRRPGARSGGYGRRGETDWEREEDEEDDRILADPYPISSVFHQQQQEQCGFKTAGQQERERVARQSYKPPSEWFKKKRPPPLPQQRPPIRTHHQHKGNESAKDRRQTPDWIHKIFHVARRGNLLKLQRVVAGMEPTLVRNLSDHRGNNLLHVLAGAGNPDAMAWLCSSFGPEMQDALLDENKRGLTPVIAAIQGGQLEALQFLVDHTAARERLAPVDGDRSLLHIAAKYGKIELVAWLAQYMESHGFEIDLRDHCGHSPLHLAARAGHASAVAVLVAHGADVTAKNDMGHRPLDLASASGHIGVAQLLRLHDAALCLSAEVLEAGEELDHLRSDYAELKSHFRDVLVIGKRFAKERDEMCRQLGRLYEDVTSLHQALLFELRSAHRDLAGTRDRVTSSRKAEEIADRNMDESVAVVEALHDKWQNQQRGWFSSSLADMEHRLLVAEDGWKRLRTSGGVSNGKQPRTNQIRPQELLRSRLAAVNAQASSIQCNPATLSSSDGSLYSDDCSQSDSDGDQLNGTATSAAYFSPPPPVKATGNSSASWYGKTPARGTMAVKATTGDSVYNTLQAAVRKIGSNPPVPPPSSELVLQPIGQTVSAPSKKPTPSSASRKELRKRLQEVTKLTSESGNASVIEVIEPSSSEEDESIMTRSMMPQDQSTPLRGNGARSFNASFTEELEKARQQQQKSRPTMLDGPSGSKSSEPLNSKALLAEPDLLAGTVSAVGATASPSRSCHDLMAGECPTEDVEMNHSTRSHSSLSSSNNTAVTLVPRKKMSGPSGFLTKFALKTRWSSGSKRNSSGGGSSKSATESTSPDPLTVGDNADDSVPQHPPMEGEAPGHNTSGVVAGLSQMFEDLSIMSGHLKMDQRSGSLRSVSATPSAGPSEPHKSEHIVNDDEEEEEHMDLPPSTSPPPVPLEIETYNSVSPSSQETSSSSTASCSRRQGSSSMPPPLAVVVGGIKTHTGATPSSSASSSTSASHGGAESLSVAASEDSGIVMARPASSASKSADSSSSPRQLASNNNNSSNTGTYGYSTFSPLRKASLAGAPNDRLSPAPPPDSDASKAAESMRQQHFRQLARIEETATTVQASSGLEDINKTQQQQESLAKTDPSDLSTRQSSGQILTWREAKLKNQVVTPPPLEERLNKARVRLEEKSIRTMKKRHHVSERPWYDVSDDESDLLTPERLTKLKTSLSTSSSNSTSDSGSEEDITV